MHTAIHSDAGEGYGGTDDAADAFFKTLTTDAEGSSEAHEDEDEKHAPKDDEGHEESTDESPEDEETEESEEDTDEDHEDEGEGDKPKPEDDDERLTKIKVDGKEVEVPIKDLKRLYGQEQALTRKSQEAADLRKAAEAVGTRHVAGLEAMLGRAQARWDQFKGINFVALMKDPDVPAGALEQLHKEAQSAHDDLTFLQNSLDTVVAQAGQERQKQLVAQARETHKTLSDPEKGIPGWSQQMYQDIRSFAITHGIPQSSMDELVDPAAIKIIHKAMLYDAGQKAVTITKKTDKTPKKIIKGNSEPTVQRTKPKGAEKAFSNFRKSGSTDDAADVFLSRMSR